MSRPRLRWGRVVFSWLKGRERRGQSAVFPLPPVPTEAVAAAETAVKAVAAPEAKADAPRNRRIPVARIVAITRAIPIARARLIRIDHRRGRTDDTRNGRIPTAGVQQLVRNHVGLAI